MSISSIIAKIAIKNAHRRQIKEQNKRVRKACKVEIKRFMEGAKNGIEYRECFIPANVDPNMFIEKMDKLGFSVKQLTRGSFNCRMMLK